MTKIKGFTIHKPERPVYVPFHPAGGDGGEEPETQASFPTVQVVDGKLDAAGSVLDSLCSGQVTDTEANDVKIALDGGNKGGFYITGATTEYTIRDSEITLSGDGFGLGGPISGAAVDNKAKLTLENVRINTEGKLRLATSVAHEATLIVRDSFLVAHGAPWPAGEEQKTFVMGPGMCMPPWPLEIDGNTRTHCNISGGKSYFYDSMILADNWAALSTDGGGALFLEANDCTVLTTKSGYCTYADTGSLVILNRCHMDVANMGAIVAGESRCNLNQCTGKCGTYGAMIHCVGDSRTQVTTCSFRDSSLRCGSESILVKSCNAEITVQNCKLSSRKGVFLATKVNDDPCAYHPTTEEEPAYGVHVHLIDQTVDQAICHGDTERSCYISLTHSTLRCGITGNPTVCFDGDSTWYAERDSEITLEGEVAVCQLDAPVGVTVTVHAEQALEPVTLKSGGSLQFV